MIETLRLSWNVVVRNWVVYRKDLIANISPTLADPGFILLSLGLGLGPYVQEMGGVPYSQFLAPGLIATTALFTAFFECSYGFYVRLTFENVYKAMLTTPIGSREVLLGEFIWVFLKGALMAFGVGLVLSLTGFILHPAALPAFALVGGLLALPCGAIGLLASSFVRNMNQFQTVYSFLIAPTFYLSGVFFPLEAAPAWFRYGAQVLPFTHAVRLMQMFAWGRFDFAEALLHTAALLVFALVLGVWSARRIHRKLVT